MILFQKGATSYGFQIGKFYLYVNYLRYWKLNLRRPNIFTFGKES